MLVLVLEASRYSFIDFCSASRLPHVPVEYFTILHSLELNEIRSEQGRSKHSGFGPLIADDIEPSRIQLGLS